MEPLDKPIPVIPKWAERLLWGKKEKQRVGFTTNKRAQARAQKKRRKRMRR